MTAETVPADPFLAMVMASRDEALDRWRAWYDAKFPPAPADCTHLHSAFGPGCPYCPPKIPAALRSDSTAARGGSTIRSTP